MLRTYVRTYVRLDNGFYDVDNLGPSYCLWTHSGGAGEFKFNIFNLVKETSFDLKLLNLCLLEIYIFFYISLHFSLFHIKSNVDKLISNPVMYYLDFHSFYFSYWTSKTKRGHYYHLLI